MAQSKPERPDKELQLQSLEKPIVMTYVVFNDILRFVGTVDEALNSVMMSQDTRDLIVRRLLSDAKKPITEVDDLIPVEKLDEMGLDFFEIDDILAWTMEHVTYFFMSQGYKLQQRMARFPEMAEKMSSNLLGTGSTD